VSTTKTQADMVRELQDALEFWQQIKSDYQSEDAHYSAPHNSPLMKLDRFIKRSAQSGWHPIVKRDFPKVVAAATERNATVLVGHKHKYNPWFVETVFDLGDFGVFASKGHTHYLVVEALTSPSAAQEPPKCDCCKGKLKVHVIEANVDIDCPLCTGKKAGRQKRSTSQSERCSRVTRVFR